MMVGREVLLRVEKPPAKPGDVAARGRATCTCVDDRELEKVRGVSLAGARGRDRRHRRRRRQRPDRADRGDHRACAARASGTISVAGKPSSARTRARTMLDAGVGHIPEDRQRRGLVLEFSLAENIALHDYRKPPDSQHGWLFPRPPDRARARRLITEFDVRGGGPTTRAGALSGGNQQKVVVAREIDAQPEGARSPRSRRAASTSARSSSCTGAWSPSATRAARSCSSRSSSTRSSRSPTGSSSCSRARSSASTRRRRPRRSSASP